MKIKPAILLKSFLTLIIGVYFQFTQAQSIIGFWEVREVKVGDEIMTPVAKWFKINEDGTYQSGNGWLQNSEGTWGYDKKNKTYLPVDKNSIKDPFGPFQVSFPNGGMTWKREEEGMHVIVMLEHIKKLPKSTADELIGLWDLKDVVKGDRSEKTTFDPDDKHYIFIRWDRIYVERTPEGKRATGYWHINGHRPEITLLSHSPGTTESWRVTVNDSELRMVGISDSNKEIERVYVRINEFPN